MAYPHLKVVETVTELYAECQGEIVWVLSEANPPGRATLFADCLQLFSDVRTLVGHPGTVRLGQHIISAELREMTWEAFVLSACETWYNTGVALDGVYLGRLPTPPHSDEPTLQEVVAYQSALEGLFKGFFLARGYRF